MPYHYLLYHPNPYYDLRQPLICGEDQVPSGTVIDWPTSRRSHQGVWMRRDSVTPQDPCLLAGHPGIPAFFSPWGTFPGINTTSSLTRSCLFLPPLNVGYLVLFSWPSLMQRCFAESLMTQFPRDIVLLLWRGTLCFGTRVGVSLNPLFDSVSLILWEKRKDLPSALCSSLSVDEGLPHFTLFISYIIISIVSS